METLHKVLSQEVLHPLRKYLQERRNQLRDQLEGEQDQVALHRLQGQLLELRLLMISITEG